MTGNLQAIGFLFTWVLLWCLGGIGIEALLLQVGLIVPGGGSWAGGLGFLLWTLLIGFAGWALFNRITGLTQPAPTLQASPWHEVPAPLQPVLAGLASLDNQQRRLLLVLSQLGDFDSVEYAQAVMASWPQLLEDGVDVRAIGIGDAGSVDRFCGITQGSQRNACRSIPRRGCTVIWGCMAVRRDLVGPGETCLPCAQALARRAPCARFCVVITAAGVISRFGSPVSACGTWSKCSAIGAPMSRMSVG